MRSSAVVVVMMVVATMGFFASESAAEPELGIALPSDAIAAEIITEAEDVLLMRKEDKMQHPVGKAKWPWSAADPEFFSRWIHLWPCCNHCGECNPEQPLNCTCNDLREGGCHPGCKKCKPLKGPIPPHWYRCEDWITNFCKHKCTVE